MPGLLAFFKATGVILVSGLSIIGLLEWVCRHHPRWRNLLAFCVALGAAYTASFALDLFVGSVLGFYSFKPYVPPVFTWTGISLGLHFLAQRAAVSNRPVGVPYFLTGGLATLMGLVGPHKHNVFVGLPLLVIGFAYVVFPVIKSRSC